MRLADMENLCIKYYKVDSAKWYDPKYSWYCTRYVKNKKNELRPLVSMEKNLLLAKVFFLFHKKN
jgi:hypothetical protein